MSERLWVGEMPGSMQRLQRDHRGFPVPWFVDRQADRDGEPDFRVMDPEKLQRAVTQRRCWVCGGQLGRYLCFVIGPMCGVNRNTAEPPCHRSCAEFSALNCPFLSQPKMRRNEKAMPEEARVAGIMIPRNPGVTLLWVTRTYKVHREHNGWLFQPGEPEDIVFYARARLATRAEVDESIRTGLPILRDVAIKHDGAEGVAELDAAVARFTALIDRALPREAAA